MKNLSLLAALTLKNNSCGVVREDQEERGEQYNEEISFDNTDQCKFWFLEKEKDDTTTEKLAASSSAKRNIVSSKKLSPNAAGSNVMFALRSLDSETAIQGSHTASSSSDIKDTEETQRESDKELEIGFITNSSASNSALILECVLLPILLRNLPRDPNVGASLVETYASKLSSAVFRASRQVESGIKLDLPQEDLLARLADKVNVVDQIETLTKLEDVATKWCALVKDKISEELKKKPEGRGAMSELDYWSQRSSVLDGLHQQTRQEAVQQVLQPLRASRNPVTEKLDEQLFELSRLNLEASDNAKFLSTLERNMRSLSSGSVTDLQDIVPELLNSIRQIWTVSRYYNREDRLVALLQRISYQLSYKVKDEININSILRSSEKGKKTKEAKALLEKWKTTYLEVRKRIEDKGAAHRRWDFDQNLVFEETDYMAYVCGDLNEISTILDEFRRFLRPDVSAVIGESGNLKDISTKVESLSAHIESVSFDIFDVKNKVIWNSTMQTLLHKVEEIDQASSHCVESAFQDLRSAEAAFRLIENFKGLKSRPVIHRSIEARYTDVLEQYARELASIEKSFHSRKGNPPRCKTAPPVAASITWALDLYKRAKTPILQFKRSNKAMLTSGFGNIVKQRYLSFARAVDSYKDSLYKEWEQSAPVVVRQGLGQSIIKEYKAEYASILSSIYATNYPNSIRTATEEAKRLRCLGFSIPDVVLTVTLQEDQISEQLGNLSALLHRRNETIMSLSEIERTVLFNQLSSLATTFHRGIESLNWTSQRIPKFVAVCSKALEKFRSFLKEVRKHINDINEVIGGIGDTSIFEVNLCDNGQGLPFVELSEHIELRRTEIVEYLVGQYRSITPLILKVEMLVTESVPGETGEFEHFYNFWESRIESAIESMIFISLSNLNDFLSNRTRACRLQASIEKREILIIPGEQHLCKIITSMVLNMTKSAQSFVRWTKRTCIERGNEHTFKVEKHASVGTTFADVAQVTCISTLANEICTFWQVFLSRELKQMTLPWSKIISDYDLVNVKHRKNLSTDVVDMSCLLVENKMNEYEQLVIAIHARMQTVSSYDSKDYNFCPSIIAYSSAFEVDFAVVARWIVNEATQCKLDYGQILYFSAKKNLLSIHTRLEECRNCIQAEPERADQVKKMLQSLHDICDSDLHMQLFIQSTIEQFSSLERFGVHVSSEDIKSASTLKDSWIQLITDCRSTDLRLFEEKDQLRDTVLAEAHHRRESSKEMYQTFKERGPHTFHSSLDDGLSSLQEWNSILSKSKGEIKELCEAEKLLGLDVADYTEVSYLDQELTKLNILFDIYYEIKVFEQSQGALLWEVVDHLKLQSTVAKFEEALTRIETDKQTFKVLAAIRLHVNQLKEALPLLAALRADSIKSRHWQCLWSQTLLSKKGELNTDKMTLEQVLSMGVLSIKPLINQVCDGALQEVKIGKAIDEIHTFWTAASLDIKKYVKHGVEKGFLLCSADDLLLQLEDHLLSLQAIGSSRHVAFYAEDVKELEHQLHTISECLEVWYGIQSKWMYLENIFVGAEDIRTQLPQECKRFESISFNYVTAMKASYSKPNALYVCTEDGKLEMLRDLTEKLDACQKSLSDYLDSKRRQFARFYFISNDELLSIVGSSDPASILPHMLKLFDEAKDLIFSQSRRAISGMSSSEGETFSFYEVSAIEGPIEKWISNVEVKMVESLRLISKENIYRYAFEQRISWMKSDKTIGMGSVLASQIWWSWQVEDSFCKLHEGDENALKILESKWTDHLSKMVDLVRSPLEENVRKKVNTLLIIDVHARDIISDLLLRSVITASQFEWESQLRFYWNRTDDDVIIKQCTGSFQYGFEYMGLNGRLVITPLTDRCYMTLTQALTFKLGGSPSGPAGTGKTETVKDLAKSMALPCRVINCGEGLDYKAMASIFSGLVQMGAWGCFDEFNRINVEVLSVVSAQLKQIQHALITESLTACIGSESNIFVKRKNGQATVGVFITMNPGYAGRTELPDNLKALFRPITMAVPDLEKITENLLFSEGFSASRILAKKIVMLYKLSKEQLSKQFHYDFGLRSLKAVLVLAGEMKRQNENLEESVLLMKIFKDANIPKLTIDDAPLFLRILGDLFTVESAIPSQIHILENHIQQQLENAGMQYSDGERKFSQIEKTIQLYETQKARHTCMLVGPTGGGKSVILNTLSKAREQAQGVIVKKYILNPKAQSIDELYGIMDPATRDWTDGILSKIFREVNQPLPPKRKNEIRWIIFDGDVDALWVENMNSVMDDNKLLTLPNGERIRLQQHCSLICEVADLQYASPATVSRCGMVWVDTNTVRPRSYFESWLTKRHQLISLVFEAVKKKYPNQACIASSFRNLFYKYAEPCSIYISTGRTLEGVSEKVSHVLNLGDMERCRQLCTLLDVCIENVNVLQRKYLQFDTEANFIHSLIWSYGSTLSLTSRERFTAFLRVNSGANLPPGDLFSFFYSMKDNRWILWSDLIPSYKAPHPFYFHQVIVPTKSSVSLDHMVNNIAPFSPMLLVGASGTSKTTSIEAYANTLPSGKFSFLKYILTSRTRSRDLQETIESLIDKRVGSGYSPADEKKLLLFLDDMNMPSHDSYGTQQPMALLLTLLDHGFFYSREKDLEQKNVTGIQYIAGMQTPGGGRNHLDPRLLARFYCVGLMEPDRETLLSIYSKIIAARAILISDEEVRLCAEKLPSASLQMYEFVLNSFPPTPTFFHYVFNLRDLSRVFEGVCSTFVENARTEGELLRLWRNEVTRVFVDRLSKTSHRTIAEDFLVKIIESNFPGSAIYANMDPLLFGISKSMEKDGKAPYVDLMDFQRVKCIFDMALKNHARQYPSARLGLSLFESALLHLLRATRMLRHQRGHGLLIGNGGSGKQSIVKLAAYTIGYDVVQICLTRGYKEMDFREDLRSLYFRLVSGPIVFLFSDAHCAHESFCEYINDMLCTGMPPSLFQGEDKDSAINLIRQNMNENNSTNTSPSDLWNTFIETCRSNLHIMLAMSPSGDKLRRRVREFPGLINNCHIDWFFDWPEDALALLADEAITENEVISQDVVEKIKSHMIFVHSSISVEARRFCDETGRFLTITSITYLTYMESFNQQIKASFKRLISAMNRLKGGLNKLNDATESVTNMACALQEQKCKVEKATADTKELLKDLDEKRSISTRAKTDATLKEIAAKEQALKISVDKEKAELAYMEAQPIVEAAAAALNEIDKGDLIELKAFANPAEEVREVCQMCSILRPTGEKFNGSWADSRKMLANPKLLDLLKQYKKEVITEKMYKECRKVLGEDEETTLSRMKKISTAGTGLLKWILACLKYYEVAKHVEPLRQQVRTMENEQTKTEDELRALNIQLSDLERELKNLESNFAAKSSLLENLESEAITMERRLDSSQKLIEGLGAEKARWTCEIENLETQRNRVPGDCLIGAAFLSYTGAFTCNFRKYILREMLFEDVLQRGIAVSPGTPDMANLFVTDNITRTWNVEGLPGDEHSVQNGILSKFSKKFPLCIDPQQQAIAWLKNHYQNENLCVKSLRDEDFMRSLELAIEYGNPFLFENVEEELDPVLDPILEQNFVIQNGKQIITIGEKSMEWNCNFRLYFCTRLSNPCYPPEVMGKVTLINYAVTEDGLCDQLLNIVVRHERPELDVQFSAIIADLAHNSRLLVELEDLLLHELSSATGNILDNTDLVRSLQDTKAKARDIKAKNQQAKETKACIESARLAYVRTAKRGVTLYFASSQLSKINYMYETSLASFLIQYVKALDIAQRNDIVEIRIENLINCCTKHIFDYVSLGVFDRHRLTFSFILLCSISKESEQLDARCLDYFLRGDTSIDLVSEAKPQKLAWLGETNWKDLIHMSKNDEIINGIKHEIVLHSERFEAWSGLESPEATLLPGEKASGLTGLKLLCIVRVLRPDRCFRAVQRWIENELGNEFVEPPKSTIKHIFSQSSSRTPIILILSPGADPYSDISRAANLPGFSSQRGFRSISLGQGQGPKAMEMLLEGANNGYWILLQNCHLLTSWLRSMEETFERLLAPHPEFRLWLSTEPSSKFPLGILQSSLKVVTEEGEGMKMKMRSVLGLIDQSFLDSCPHPRIGVLMFCLSFFHAVILDRRKYGKIGWNVSYDFSDSDFAISRDLIAMYLGRANSEGDNIPWRDLKYLIGDAMYGGRVSDSMDVRIMSAYMDNYMGDFLFDMNNPFYFSRDVFDYRLPSGDTKSLADLLHEVESFPLANSARVLGLHSNVEIGYHIDRIKSLWLDAGAVMPRVDNSGIDSSSDVNQMADLVQSILTKIPGDKSDDKAFDTLAIRESFMKKDQDRSISPCLVVLLQELDRFNLLRNRMVSSLDILKKAIAGEVGINDEMEEMLLMLTNGQVPKSWKKLAPESLKSLGSWMQHFLGRYKQYHDWIEHGEPAVMWLSGLHIPETYLTAVIQTACRNNCWPLDKTSLITSATHFMDAKDLKEREDGICYINGLHLEGAGWDMVRSCLKLQDAKVLSTTLPVLKLVPTLLDGSESKGMFATPVYVTSSRRNAAGHGLVTHLNLPTKEPSNMWILQGVALVLNLTD